jgi:2-methylcitrate dehydratase PrpD
LDITGREQFAAEEVEAVDVVTIGGIPLGMVGPYPPNMLSAKFNIPYAVASAIVRHGADITAFYRDAVSDPAIQDLSARVNVTLNPEMTVRRDDQPCAEVTVRLRDGRTFYETTNSIRGDAGNPAPHQQLIDKFLFLTQDILGLERANSVVKAIDRLDDMPDVRELTALLGGEE